MVLSRFKIFSVAFQNKVYVMGAMDQKTMEDMINNDNLRVLLLNVMILGMYFQDTRNNASAMTPIGIVNNAAFLSELLGLFKMMNVALITTK